MNDFQLSFSPELPAMNPNPPAEPRNSPPPSPDESPCCRRCGRPHGGRRTTCPVCGNAQSLSSAERHRLRNLQRNAAPDNVEIAAIGARFEQQYQELISFIDTHCRKVGSGLRGDSAFEHDRAMELAEGLIDTDPSRPEGYEWLARLCEGADRRDRAAACYRELMLRYPDDQATRTKYKAVTRCPVRRPPQLDRLFAVLCFALAWMSFWLLQGVGWLPVRFLFPGVAVCGLLIYFLMIRLQRRGVGRLSVEPGIAQPPFEPVPLPESRLSWRDEARRARWLAGVIREHTNVRVPILSPYRVILSILLSLVLTLALCVVTWINRSPSVFLALPAGIFLIYYFLLIRPRMQLAYILLQHFREETDTLWADPDLPFQPQSATRPPRGEFLIEHPDEVPVRWAWQALPYGYHVRDVLDSVQQTLNRHWEFHAYYQSAAIARRYEIFPPIGGRVLGVFAFGNFSLALILAVVLLFTGSSQELLYRQEMAFGFSGLWDAWRGFEEGAAADAADFNIHARANFANAERIFPERALPALCAAFSYEIQGLPTEAEAAYRRALAKRGLSGPTRMIVLNDYANYLHRQERFEEAEQRYREALDLAPFDADVLNNLGQVKFRQAFYDEAERYLRRAVEARGDHGFALANLGRVYEFQGDPTRARLYYEGAVDSQPHHPHTQYAVARLASGLDLRDNEPITLM
jgi:Tfp pilus assembly protein PilF